MHPPPNFYSSAALVGRVDSTDSAAGWKSKLLFQSLPALHWKKLEEGWALPDSSGRGWKSPIECTFSCIITGP